MTDHLTEAAKRIAWAMRHSFSVQYPEYPDVKDSSDLWAVLTSADKVASQAAARAVLPEGSVVVPREPTDVMLDDGDGAFWEAWKFARERGRAATGKDGVCSNDFLPQVYRAMIAAATEDAR